MDRYQRQRVLPEVGDAGQARRGRARVVIVGCGGLGSPAAAWLAGAGIGHLTLIDGDTPHPTNLHRQVFFTEGESAPKAELLADHLRSLNPEIEVQAKTTYLEKGNVRNLLAGANLVMECTDHAATKHLVNDACHLLSIPLVYAAVHKYEGYVALFPNENQEDIHLRDVFPAPDPTLPDCATVGVLPTAVGLVALLQATAALNFLLGIGQPPVRELLTYNALDHQQLRIKLAKNYTAPVKPPWEARKTTPRATLEVGVEALGDQDRFGTVFSMLTEDQEPEVPEGVIRLTKRNPLGQVLKYARQGEECLIYCKSGKLSLVLAAEVRKANAKVTAYSLRGGKPAHWDQP
jgi:molybdopterin/thiamine biosynthesis adenylyltransferase